MVESWSYAFTLSPPVDIGTCADFFPQAASLSIRLGIRKSLTLVGFTGNPEPVTEKTLKNSTEFFTKHDGLAWHGPCVGNGAGREKF